MGKAQAEIKAKLLAEYETMLDDLLGQGEAADGLSLTDIEERALGVRAKVGVQVTAALLENSSGQNVPGPRCPGCGQEMRYKGKKHRYLRTRSGDVGVARAYYYCQACRQGLFPPG
jgi:hypothetical protein